MLLRYTFLSLFICVFNLVSADQRFPAGVKVEETYVKYRFSETEDWRGVVKVKFARTGVCNRRRQFGLRWRSSGSCDHVFPESKSFTGRHDPFKVDQKWFTGWVRPDRGSVCDANYNMVYTITKAEDPKVTMVIQSANICCDQECPEPKDWQPVWKCLRGPPGYIMDWYGHRVHACPQ
ncbi:hypothetical protein DFH28DRAFT_554582 [Melampsora americana]|nr:hypothetical protein DFH28DRAFT_554582 [Melampsora americana]